MKTPIRLHNSATADIPIGKSNGIRLKVEEIRQRAYEIFLARGGIPGNELQDWLRAEQELKQQDAARVS